VSSCCGIQTHGENGRGRIQTVIKAVITVPRIMLLMIAGCISLFHRGRKMIMDKRRRDADIFDATFAECGGLNAPKFRAGDRVIMVPAVYLCDYSINQLNDMRREKHSYIHGTVISKGKNPKHCVNVKWDELPDLVGKVSVFDLREYWSISELIREEEE
jgi:hypothetical protein